MIIDKLGSQVASFQLVDDVIHRNKVVFSTNNEILKKDGFDLNGYSSIILCEYDSFFLVLQIVRQTFQVIILLFVQMIKGMIRNISYNTKELRQEINDTVGKSYSFLKRIKLKGNGSQRYELIEASDELESLIKRDLNTNFCNIELRENGIILRFRSKLETFGWIVPYHTLSIFKADHNFTIFSGAEFVRLKAAHNASLNFSFIKKLVNLKSEYFQKSNDEYYGSHL